MYNQKIICAMAAITILALPNLAIAATKPANTHAYDNVGNGSTPRAADGAASDVDTSTTHEATAQTTKNNTKNIVNSSDPRVVKKGQQIEHSNELGSDQVNTGKANQ